ncbi:MAG: type II toxin-antitoxin system RelE/ParE family toxin [Coriobacteriia bacterium]
MKVIWAPLAREHVAQAFAYIAAERPSAAVRWFDAIVDVAGSLSAFPGMGRMTPEAERPELREALVDPYRLIYRYDSDQIVVLGVFHIRQQIDAEMLEG